MNKELESLFAFITYSARLREVTRHNNATANRKESVAEHSWNLALMAWLLHKTFEQECGTALDLEKMLKLGLMHDLVEIDAGDPSVWDSNHGVGKAEREEAVAQKHFSELPPELSAEFFELWYEYEKGETLESQIVRGIDRINPAMMRLITKQGWSDVNGSVESLDAIQLPRLQFSPTLMTLYAQIKAQAVEQGLLQP